jgi:hypothetical protein
MTVDRFFFCKKRDAGEASLSSATEMRKKGLEDANHYRLASLLEVVLTIIASHFARCTLKRIAQKHIMPSTTYE